MLDPQKVKVLLDPVVRPLGHLLEGKSVLNLLDRSRNWRGDFLDAALDGRLEECDVALPPWRPLDGLPGDTILGTGQEHVEGGERGDACGAEGEDLGAARGGDAERHDGCGWIEWRFVVLWIGSVLAVMLLMLMLFSSRTSRIEMDHGGEEADVDGKRGMTPGQVPWQDLGKLKHTFTA